MPPRFERYVAIGDSSTEGLDDPDGAGGFRGWANRLAERIARTQGALLYANLAVRGKLTREIREEQLAPALEMRPDLATVFAGSNDLLERRFDADHVRDEVCRMQRAFIDAGAVVLTFTLPDLTGVMPIGRFLRRRIGAMNDALRRASAESGARLVDFAAHAVGSDRRMWSDDRFHANADGHARIADALAHALGLPGCSDDWSRPLPPPGARQRLARLVSDLAWCRRHLLGWLRTERRPAVPLPPKRPRLEPVPLSPTASAR